MAIKQTDFDDDSRDLRVEIKSHDKMIAVQYVYPGTNKVTYCELPGWSPLSEDDLAKALAAKLGTEIEILNDSVATESGVDEEALKALFESIDGPAQDIDIDENENIQVLKSFENPIEQATEVQPSEVVSHHSRCRRRTATAIADP